MSLLRKEVTSSEDSAQYPNLLSVPYVANVHWSTQYAESPPWKEGKDRPLLMAFFGTQKNKTEYSKEIRPFLYKECESFGNSSCKIMVGKHIDMFKQKQATKFCLEPA